MLSIPKVPVNKALREALSLLPWRRRPAPELIAKGNQRRCSECMYLNDSPAIIEEHQPNGTDYDLPCVTFGQKPEFRACSAFERRGKGLCPTTSILSNAETAPSTPDTQLT